MRHTLTYYRSVENISLCFTKDFFEIQGIVSWMNWDVSISIVTVLLVKELVVQNEVKYFYARYIFGKW